MCSSDLVRSNPDNVNAGLLTYPVLMASDIIIHKAHKVPVGKDQEQNLEMTRKFAARFNRMYDNELFPIPEPFNFGETLVKIPGLDGSGKMGKSEGNGLYLIDEPRDIRKKVMKAVTDTGPLEPDSPVSEPVNNLFTIMSVVSKPETLQFFKEAYSNCSIRYGDLKKQLAEDIVIFTEPLRERIKEISADEVYLRKVVNMGKEKAHASAAGTLREVRELIGFRPFGFLDACQGIIFVDKRCSAPTFKWDYVPGREDYKFVIGVNRFYMLEVDYINWMTTKETVVVQQELIAPERQRNKEIFAGIKFEFCTARDSFAENYF